MLRNRWMSPIPLLVLTALAVPQLGAAEIRDRAGMFGAEAVRKAQAELERGERASRVPVVIETVASIPGLERGASASQKRTAIETLAEKKASDIGYEGAYLLISKDDQVFSELLVKERYASRLPREKRRAVRDALLGEFKNRDFDAGLVKASGVIAEALSEAPVPAARRAAPGAPAPRRGEAGKFGLGTLLMIGLGIFGVLLLLRVLGGLFNRGAGLSRADGDGRHASRHGPRPRLRGPGLWLRCPSRRRASSPACSEGLAEPWPATGFMTSSRAATRARATPTRPPTLRRSAGRRPAAMRSSAGTTMAARGPPGPTRAEMPAATGAAATAAATGAAAVAATGAAVIGAAAVDGGGGW